MHDILFFFYDPDCSTVRCVPGMELDPDYVLCEIEGIEDEIWVPSGRYSADVGSPLPDYLSQDDLRTWRQRANAPSGAAASVRPDYKGCIYRVQSHERLDTFVDLAGHMTNEEYWRLLAGVWVDSEVTYPDRLLWIRLFESERPGREHLMTQAEREILVRLPSQLTLYRGYAGGRAARGMSWSLCRKTALRFAQEYSRSSRRSLAGCSARGRPPMLATARAQKCDVWAYLNDRQEEEIVIHPQRLVAVQTTKA